MSSPPTTDNVTPTPSAHPPPPPSNRRGRRGSALAAAIALIGIALAALAWNGSTGDVRDRTATISPSGPVDRVVIDVEAGAVELVSGDELLVEVTRSERNFVMHHDLTDGLLEVSVTCPRSALLRGCRTPVHLVVPPAVAVVASTEAGTITASGLTGSADLRADAGAIDVHDLEGAVRLRSDTGDIRGTVLTGAVTARTTSGAIAIRMIEAADRVEATTEVGSIDLIVPDADYRVDAGATLGRTTVDIADTPDAGRSLVARSELGAVTIRTGGG